MVVNIFLIYPPLHYLAAESIVSQFERGSRNYLFYLKSKFGQLVDPSAWDGVEFLPWPRYYPERGMFGRMRRTIRNLTLVDGVCAGATELRLHAPVIDTEAINYLIRFLQSSHPGASFSVRLIPDGLLNVQRHPLGYFKETLQYVKKARRLTCPSLNYYTFRGDRTGSDDAIVDRIYVLEGFPHQYDRAKSVELPLLRDCPRAVQTASTKRALVIGQPLVVYRRFSQEDMRAVSEGIRAFIGDSGIEHIVYKSHPRDSQREFSHPDYQELTIQQPLETYLASTPHDLVIGVCSTALLTARMILPPSCRVVAYGMDMMKYRGDQDRESIELPFRSLKVEMVSHRKTNLFQRDANK